MPVEPPRPETDALMLDRTEQSRVLVACQPKSGSTYLSGALGAALDVPRRVLHDSAEVQELSRRMMEPGLAAGFVGQSHILPTKNAVRLLNEMEVSVVVLERSIADCLVSLYDMYLERIESQQGVWKGEFISQFGIFGPFFLEMSPENRLDYLIECAAPWYFKFTAGWRSEALGLYRAPVFVRYEEFFHTPGGSLDTVLVALGLARDARDRQMPSLETDAKSLRFNVGKVGRGAEILTPEQQRRLWKMAEVQLSRTPVSIGHVIGLPEPG